MLLNLIKNAVNESKYSSHKKKTISTITEAVGSAEIARRIVEAYQVGPSDYNKWLDVILGYARENGYNLSRKATFQDVAYGVLENDPAPIDIDMQDAIVNTLWANFKAQQQQSKVDKVHRAKEEEEQLKYALKKMRGHEDEQEAAFSQAYKAAQGMEDEEYDFDSLDQDDVDYIDRNAQDWDEQDEFTYDDMDDDFGDRDIEFDRDEDIMSRGREMQHSRDLEDFDPASDEGMDKYQQIQGRGQRMRHERDLEDFDPASKPRTYRALEQEEMGKKDYASPFHSGQVVICKKDGKSYTVDIPDGPGDNVGINVDGIVKMVPAKDLEVPKAREEEETTSKQSGGKISFLHDVLTGEHSREHMNALQKKIEIEAANAWTRHHAKMPKNPHPKGSIAYKAWEKGIASAAKEVWAPKPVVDPGKLKARNKQKNKK